CKARRPRREPNWPCREDNTVRRYRSLFLRWAGKQKTREALRLETSKKRGCGLLLLRCVGDVRGCRAGVWSSPRNHSSAWPFYLGLSVHRAKVRFALRVLSRTRTRHRTSAASFAALSLPARSVDVFCQKRADELRN